MSVGIRSGVNWMRFQSRPEHDAQRLDQLGLGQTRHADEQAMPARQQRHQRLLDHRILAEDGASPPASRTLPRVAAARSTWAAALVLPP